MGLLSRLFGRGGGDASAPAADAVEHHGYTITPVPQQAGGQWRVSATIEKDGRTHHLIRADTLTDRDQCADVSVAKARQVIDEQGERLFG